MVICHSASRAQLIRQLFSGPPTRHRSFSTLVRDHGGARDGAAAGAARRGHADPERGRGGTRRSRPRQEEEEEKEERQVRRFR